MSVKAVKGILWAVVAIGLAMIFATASPSLDRRESIALFLAACALFIAAALWYRRVIPAAEARDEEARMRQVAVLKQQIVLTGHPIEVKSSRGILLLLLMVCLAIGIGYQVFAAPSIESMTMLAVCVVLALFLALWSLPLIGKPALIIRRDGIEAVFLGFFPWEEIESIGIRSYSNRRFTSHSLHLHVPKLREREKGLGFLQRARRRMTRGAEANFVVIPLGFPSPPAPAVQGLCYELWRERTGRTSVATTAPPREFVEMKRRADEQFEALKRVSSIAETNPAEAVRMLEELKKQFPLQEPRPRRRLSRGEKARMELLMAEMRTIDPRDEAARKRIFDKHVRAEVRRRGALALVLVILGFAIVMAVAILRNG